MIRHIFTHFTGFYLSEKSNLPYQDWSGLIMPNKAIRLRIRPPYQVQKPDIIVYQPSSALQTIIRADRPDRAFSLQRERQNYLLYLLLFSSLVNSLAVYIDCVF
jgi:hypothetical protein